jgi:methionine-rich copper-binding protein CopC
MSARRRPVAAAALLVGASVIWAPPASGHAILLRTEPAPQTTVKTAPSAVRLVTEQPCSRRRVQPPHEPEQLGVRDELALLLG